VIESSAVASVSRMMTEIRNAESVDPSSTFGTNLVGTSGYLRLNTGVATPALVKFYVNGSSSLAVDEDGVYSGPLTSTDARVKSLIFRSISTANSQAVKIELEIESGSSTNYKSKKFYDTAILRGSY
jgi:hypothetical protein